MGASQKGTRAWFPWKPSRVPDVPEHSDQASLRTTVAAGVRAGKSAGKRSEWTTGARG